MKKNEDLYELFLDELADMYNSEHQIIDTLPKLIKLASAPDLKDALQSHLDETIYQAERIEKIFFLLGEKPKEKVCKAMKGILKEGDEITADKAKSPLLDATIISAAQKVEHYEIASYGTLRSFAQHVGLDKEVISLLQGILDEEAGADKKLTKIADGSLFASGINKKASATK